jgi:hypothetical protein
MGGAVPPLPRYAFMAWCSFRGSTGATFTFYLYAEEYMNQSHPLSSRIMEVLMMTENNILRSQKQK